MLVRLGNEPERDLTWDEVRGTLLRWWRLSPRVWEVDSGSFAGVVPGTAWAHDAQPQASAVTGAGPPVPAEY